MHNKKGRNKIKNQNTQNDTKNEKAKIKNKKLSKQNLKFLFFNGVASLKLMKNK